jgi:hypothetical protein
MARVKEAGQVRVILVDDAREIPGKSPQCGDLFVPSTDVVMTVTPLANGPTTSRNAL